VKIHTMPEKAQITDKIDSSYLETLMGYNATRASIKVIELFTKRMAVYDLRHVDFSILSIIMHNPGITSRQLCGVLSILPPNLVGKISLMEKRELVSRRPHPQDGRAVGLYLTETGAVTDLGASDRVTSSGNPRAQASSRAEPLAAAPPSNAASNRRPQRCCSSLRRCQSGHASATTAGPSKKWMNCAPAK
jgi:hypothetical protein